jgi:hypothetical protein
LIIPADKRSWSGRGLRIIASTGVVAAVLLAGVLAVIITNRSEPETARPPTSVDAAAMQQWWSAAHEHFDELQGAVSDTQAALEHHDDSAFEPSCQKMHDAGVVGLRAHLPAPDPDLTAELDAAINDAHEAAHMCLSAISQSQNNYAGEFVSNLDQAEKHLKAALDIVNTRLFEA